MAQQKTFKAELYEGHKGHFAVDVPFDPREAWGARLEPTGFYNSKGCPVRGTVNGVRFEGFIGYKYRRFWLLVDAPLRKQLGAAAGDVLKINVAPRAANRRAEDPRFEALRKLLEPLPGVAIGRQNGKPNFRAGKKIFAFLRPEGVALTLPRARSATLVKAGRARPLVMGERKMTEWVVLHRARPAEYARDLALLKEALAFASEK